MQSHGDVYIYYQCRCLYLQALSLCSCQPNTLSPQVPGPGPAPAPPPPPPSLCPRPPPGSDLKCTFKDNTTIHDYKANSYSMVDVPANNYSACCHACTSDVACHTALMTHGPKSASIDFCWLIKKNSTQLQLRHDGDACPNLSFTLFAA